MSEQPHPFAVVVPQRAVAEREVGARVQHHERVVEGLGHSAPEHVVQRRRGHEGQEDAGEKRLRHRKLNVRFRVIEPRHERRERRDEGEQREPAPVAERGQRDNADVDQQRVRHHLVACARAARALAGRLVEPAYQERREVRAHDAQDGERRRLVPQRQRGGAHADESQHADGGIGGYQVVEGERGKDGQVQDGDSAAHERLGVHGIAPPPVLARADQRQARPLSPAESARSRQSSCCRTPA